MSFAQSSRGFRAISHTADLGAEVWADSLESLYATAALAMFRLMGDPVTLHGTDTFTIESSGIDRDDLLVRLLSDLLVRFAQDDLYVTDARPIALSHRPDKNGALDEWIITVECKAGRIDRTSESGLIEIKAVTYHDIYVGQGDEGRYEARVIFDL